jgi:hypothetical protein
MAPLSFRIAARNPVLEDVGCGVAKLAHAPADIGRVRADE